MKIVLTVLIPLFAIGVFIDGKETSNVELESVMEGDSVTLKSGVTHLQTDDEIEWRFNGNRIAKIKRDSIKISAPETFGDRLNLDNQTGDLKISNIKKTDSGQYKLKVSTTRGSPEMTFTVNVLPAGAVMKVTLMKGDLVTLLADPTDMQGCDVIKWRFRHQNSLVAEIDRKTGIISTSDGRFRDGLQLDNQTGSLTIKNIGTSHSGIYEVDISSTISSYTIHRTQSFSVTVMGEMKSVSVKEGETFTLQTDIQIQKNDEILWMFRDTVLAEMFEAGQRFKLYDDRFKDRLKPDHQTGSLIITNTTTTDFGHYNVKISSSRYTINKRFIVAVKEPDVRKGAFGVKEPDLDSDSRLPRGAEAGIVVGILVVAAVAGGIYYRIKISKPKKRTGDNGELAQMTSGTAEKQNLKKQDTGDPADEENKSPTDLDKLDNCSFYSAQGIA